MHNTSSEEKYLCCKNKLGGKKKVKHTQLAYKMTTDKPE